MQAGRIELTDEQKKAVEHFKGPMLVVAGPGAGKTRVIVERVVKLIDERGVPSDSIVVITFSNKAADELKERIIKRIGPRGETMQISTIHSFCNRILRNHADRHSLGSRFDILEEEAQLMFIFEKREELGLGIVNELAFKDIQEFFNESQENMVCPDELMDYYKKFGGSKKEKRAAMAYKKYLELTEEMRLLDFSGLQWRVIKLLRDNPDVLEDLRSHYRFIMVDEYQDTSPVQEKFIELLAGEEKNIFAVGDEDQSIYGFRGSTPQNFLNFQKKYSAETVILNKNFRSVPGIVRVTQKFIDEHRMYPKKIEPVRDSGNRVFILDNHTHADEPSNVVGIIKDLERYGIIPHYGYVTLLFRSVKKDATEIINELKKEGIPFNLWGDSGFFDREEIIYILYIFHYLRDEDKRILTKTRGTGLEYLEGEVLEISEETIKRIMEIGENEVRKYRHHNEFLKAGFSNREDIKKLVSLNRLMDTEMSLLEKYYEILEISGYPEKLISRYDDFSKEKLYNIARFTSIIRDYTTVSNDADIDGFLKFLRMAKLKKTYDQIILENPYSVNIMTMHRSKGLEFPVVIVCSVFNGKVPLNFKSYKDVELPDSLKKYKVDSNLLEERRLFYVSMTRAQDLLIISATENHRQRIGYSPFIEELKGKSGLMPVDANEAPLIIKNRCEVRDTEIPDTIKISFSEVKKYLKCPFLYMMEYEFGFEVPPTLNQLFGLAVHDCLRRINIRMMKNMEITDDYIKRLTSECFRRVEISQESLKTIGKLLRRYAENIRSRAGRIVSAEKPFSILKDGVLIRGRTDLIIENDRGEMEIVDFKVTTVDSLDIEELKLQLGIYRHSLGYKFAAHWIYTFLDSSWVLVDPAENIDDILLKVTSGIRMEDFAPKESDLCRWCIFSSLCGIWKAEHGSPVADVSSAGDNNEHVSEDLHGSGDNIKRIYGDYSTLNKQLKHYIEQDLQKKIEETETPISGKRYIYPDKNTPIYSDKNSPKTERRHGKIELVNGS